MLNASVYTFPSSSSSCSSRAHVGGCSHTRFVSPANDPPTLLVHAQLSRVMAPPQLIPSACMLYHMWIITCAFIIYKKSKMRQFWENDLFFLIVFQSFLFIVINIYAINSSRKEIRMPLRRGSIFHLFERIFFLAGHVSTMRETTSYGDTHATMDDNATFQKQLIPGLAIKKGRKEAENEATLKEDIHFPTAPSFL